MSAVLVYITVPTAEEGERITRLLLERRLVACVNMMAPHKSMYWWQGKIDQAEEIVIIAKTRAALFDDVKTAVCEMHSYECPCIVALPITDGHAPFLTWIEQETGAD
ncbi:MAG: divalent-cation tolerance protein CutA [Rhodospirillales bacterium]|nr:divalent-cation tolerance protein CutA [Rhodospirillales bacterium]